MKTVTIPRYCPHHPPPRHCLDFKKGKKYYLCRADSAMGRAMYPSKWEKEDEVWGVFQECRQAGWRAWNYPVEVGCRGFPAPSLGKMLLDLGIVGQACKLAIKKASYAAERSSSWLWLERNDSSWKSSTNGQCLISTATNHSERPGFKMGETSSNEWNQADDISGKQ